jgi:hypothetical protein
MSLLFFIRHKLHEAIKTGGEMTLRFLSYGTLRRVVR